jgi:hypothetical protein
VRKRVEEYEACINAGADRRGARFTVPLSGNFVTKLPKS